MASNHRSALTMAQADGDDDADLPEYLRAAIREDERERRAQVIPKWLPPSVQPPICTDTTTQCRC